MLIPRRKVWRWALVLLVATGTSALADSLIHNLLTGTTTPMPANSCVYVDQGPGTDTAACQDQDNYWGRLFKLLSSATVSKTANYTVQGTDNGITFDNTGAAGEVDFTLPAEANNMNFTFCVVAAFTVKVIAPTGVKIAIGASNSATAGNVSNATPFGCVTLYSPNGATTQWIARSSTGTWTVTELARKRYIA